MRTIFRSSRLTIAALTVAALAGCRDKSPAPVDSSLSNDLALAQQQVANPQFNDAPAGGNAAAAPAKGAPTPKPEPPRARAQAPRPSPRREAPPAPIQRTPAPTPPQPVANNPTPAPAAATGPAAGMIGSGTRVGMSTNSQVCTANLLPGDKLTATVTNGAVGINGASIPSGATVVLEVASVDKRDPIEQSQIQFRVRSIDVNGEPYPVSGDISNLGALQPTATPGNNNEKEKIIGGVVAGAVLGRILGHSTKATVIGAAAGGAAGTVAAKRGGGGSADACLPQGSPMRLTINRDVVVNKADL